MRDSKEFPQHLFTFVIVMDVAGWSFAPADGYYRTGSFLVGAILEVVLVLC